MRRFRSGGNVAFFLTRSINLAQSRGIDEPKTTLTACFLTVLRLSAGYDCKMLLRAWANDVLFGLFVNTASLNAGKGFPDAATQYRTSSA